jgi:hypothetical protein
MVAGVEKEERPVPLGACNEYAGETTGDGNAIMDLDNYLN